MREGTNNHSHTSKTINHFLFFLFKSKFVTAYIGSSIGVSICYPIFGLIMKVTSWENVFHFCAISGTIWFVLWMIFVFDSPEQHPRIHEKEKEYILKSLGSSVVRGETKKVKTPWKAILTSVPMWMNIVAQVRKEFRLTIFN